MHTVECILGDAIRSIPKRSTARSRGGHSDGRRNEQQLLRPSSIQPSHHHRAASTATRLQVAQDGTRARCVQSVSLSPYTRTLVDSINESRLFAPNATPLIASNRDPIGLQFCRLIDVSILHVMIYLSTAVSVWSHRSVASRVIWSAAASKSIRTHSTSGAA